MQSSSRAPLLSATLSTDSCWIMSASLLQDFSYPPPGLLGDRPGLNDANAIADAACVLLVVNLEAARVTDDLLVERVRFEHLHHHDHGLLHLVAHDHPVTNLATRTRRLGCVTHRHPPGRRRFPRLRAWARGRAPRTRQPELRRGRRPAPRGVGRAWPRAAPEPASISTRLDEPQLLRPARAEVRVRSRSSRSWRGRSRAGSREPGGGSPPVRSPAGNAPRRAADAACSDGRRAQPWSSCAAR